MGAGANGSVEGLEPIDGDDPLVVAAPDVHVVETHSSVLFFLDDRVYKMKKAVDLGFLDFTTVEARREACRQEVALNRRMAPDAYLGVAEVIGPDRKTMEHLVVMRRMPDAGRLTACIGRGEDVDGALRAIARQLAALHDHRAPDPAHDRLGSLSSVRARWVAGFEQLADLAEEGTVASHPLEARIEELVLRYLAGRASLFEHRVRRGRIRDGHGDLQAEDIFVVDDVPQVLDCLDFSDEYRWGDVLADAAFLAMDLERLGRPDLGERFLALHREFGADTWPPSLAHHYVAYRAHVRAKVGVLRAVQRGEAPGGEVDELLALALRHLEQGRVRLVVVGGAPGTGKSTTAGALADELGAALLRSDEVRRRDDGRGYQPAEVRRTYDEVLAEARRLLGLGEHVVLDATYRSAEERAAVRRLAADAAADLTELRCVLDPHEAARRVARRIEAGGDASDATPEVALALAADFDPWPEAVELDTACAPDEVLAAARRAVEGEAEPDSHGVAAAIGDRTEELATSGVGA
ncbi:MAG: AAA family ATPase [Acidimicrobiales bacterium]|nr:AAA family ATPase [Acidimicrobiales bacterium]HRW38224.1 AAA family ATPase [Aquihabitans sp.]